MRWGYGFNVKRMGVGVTGRGVEAQPGTGDPRVSVVALEAASDTSELHVHVKEVALQGFGSFVKDHYLIP